MSEQGLERLDVWCKARDFALHVYREVLPVLPPEEKYGLNQQIWRAVQSIPANIAEGYGRYYYRENIHYCYIARGSLVETLSHLVLAAELSYLPGDIYKRLARESEDLVRLINGYIAYLKRSKQGEKEPGSSLSIRESIEPYTIENEDLSQ
jgi:four helix bundle protein